MPLIAEKWTYLLKTSALTVFVIYSYAILTLNVISPLNWLSACFYFAGALFVAKAKLDLSKHHTWAGYYMETPKLVARGIYSYVRHPLYVGIYLFVFGIIFSLVESVNWYLSAIALVAVVYVLAFLAVAAKRETQILETKLGTEFSEYKKKVHFCLPIRKFKQTEHTKTC